MGERKALIIASNHYEQEDLPHLASPAADAEALSKVLGDPRIGDFNVRVARDEPSHQIAARVDDMLADCRKDDLLLIHFSCHGLKKPSGELYFAARNTRRNRLDSTALSAEFLQRCLRDSPARQVVLFLDCCYSGAFPSGVMGRAGEINALDSFPSQRLGRERSRVVITAAGSTQLALEPLAEGRDGPPRPSFFTAAMVEGLATGAADRDEDGWITVDELYDYVLEKLQDLAPGQTPRRQVDMDGDFYLARSQRRRIKQTSLPAARSGALSGHIALKGPSGEAVVEVDLEVGGPVPEPPPDDLKSGSSPSSGESGSPDVNKLGTALGDFLRHRAGSGSATRRRRGADVETETTLSFGEAMDGATVTLRLTGEGPCPACEGNGAKPGTVPKVCLDCQGSGRATSSRVFRARIPAGVADGRRIRLSGQGAPGEHGGTNGDLYVRVRVAPHPVFGRSGDDLTVAVPVTLTELALGVEIRVPTYRGLPVTVRIPSGTPNGRVFRIPGRGVRGRDGTYGALLVTVEVVVPQNPSQKAKNAIDELREGADWAEAKRAELIAKAGLSVPATRLG
jgi:DnaJ-class molecular chaperone